jgi:tetratricopeptide (TPR) repeat protein
MKKRLQWKLLVSCLLVISTSGLAQEPTGGGSLVRDITGGAALIFRAPKDPTVHDAGGGQSTIGGGKVKGRKTVKPPVRQQDQVIARANAARSAPKPRYEEAEQQYQLAAQIAPDDARAYAGLGNVYVDQGKFNEAVGAYQKALKIKSDYSAALLPLAFSLARLNRYEEAIALYQQILVSDPNNPEIHNNISFAFNHTNKFRDAVEASQNAIRLLGETGSAYTQGFQERTEALSYAYKNLGNAFNGLERYDEAANALKRATEIEPKNAAAHFNLGLALYNAKRYSEAILSYKEVIKLRPTLAQAHFNLGLAYVAVNDKAGATAEYEALKTMNPDLAKQLQRMLK